MNFVSNIKKMFKNVEKSNVQFRALTLVAVFIISCFIGWTYEQIFYFIQDGTTNKVGFLYGPYLPIYGFGATAMAFLLKPLKRNPILFFFCAVFVTGTLEFITGATIMKLWNIRLWTYEGLLFNIGGFVCLRSVVAFASAGLFLIYILEPFIEKLVAAVPVKCTISVSIGVTIVMIIDFFCTLLFRHPIFR